MFVMKLNKHDLQRAIGSFQLCVTQDAGFKAVCGSYHFKHFLQKMTRNQTFFADALNTFNHLNPLPISKAICSPLALILNNTYRNASWPCVDGQCMLSKEGTTQGDPLTVVMHVIGIQPQKIAWMALLNKCGMLICCRWVFSTESQEMVGPPEKSWKNSYPEPLNYSAPSPQVA